MVFQVRLWKRKINGSITSSLNPNTAMLMTRVESNLITAALLSRILLGIVHLPIRPALGAQIVRDLSLEHKPELPEQVGF